MQIRPITAVNTEKKNNYTNFCAAPYVVGSEAKKVIREMVRIPRFENRGLLTSLLTFLRSKEFEYKIGSSKTCYIDDIILSSRRAYQHIDNIYLPIPVCDTLTICCKDDIGPAVFCVKKDSDAIYNQKAEKYVEKDKRAAVELLGELPWWKKMLLR